MSSVVHDTLLVVGEMVSRAVAPWSISAPWERRCGWLGAMRCDAFIWFERCREGCLRRHIDTWLSIGLLNLLGHGSVNALFVIIQALTSGDGVTDGFDEAIAACIVVDTSCSAAAVPLDVAALWAAVCISVRYEVLSIDTESFQSSCRCNFYTTSVDYRFLEPDNGVRCFTF